MGGYSTVSDGDTLNRTFVGAEDVECYYDGGHENA